MTHLKKYLALGLCSLMLCAPVQAAEAAGSPAEDFPMDPSVMKPWINSEVIGMVTEDVTADLKDDFYLAVNHDWILNTKLRPGYTSETEMVHGTMAMVNERCLGIVTDKTLSGWDAEIVRAYYELWLDWEGRNEAGLSPFMPAIEKLDAVENLDEMSDFLLSEDYFYWGKFPANIVTGENYLDSTVYDISIGPEELILGDTSVYEHVSEVLGEQDTAFKDTCVYMLGRIGREEEAEDIILKAMEFEAELAAHERSYDEKNDPDKFQSKINPVTMEELSALSPAFPLTEYMEKYGWAESRLINLDEPEWLKGLNQAYTEENLEKIKDWALIKLLLEIVEKSDEDAYRTQQAIQMKYDEIDESETDEELAFNECIDRFPDEFARLYIQKYITPEDRTEIEKICREVADTYREMLSETEWLSPETREKAVQKLDKMQIWSLYPGKWSDESMFHITAKEDGGTYADACRAYKDGVLQCDLANINQSVDPEIWPVNVLETNAQYLNPNNAICIMAGFLGDSVWRSGMSIEEKYGTIGCIIGHEISHAYDPQGAQYDENGNVADWWTKEDYEEFNRRAKKAAAWFDQVIAFDDGTPYPGTVVQREAIADMAGMKCILKMAEKIEGFNYDAFFRANAAMWARIDTLPKTQHMLTSDIHPFNYLRSNVTMQQFDEFTKTYGIKEGDGMYLAPENKIAVW